MAEAQPGGRRPAGVFDFERHGERIAIRCEDGTTVSYRHLAAIADDAARGFGASRTLVMLATLVSALAGASFYIYLTHIVPIHILRHVLHLRVDEVVIPAALVPGAAIRLLLKIRRPQQSVAG